MQPICILFSSRISLLEQWSLPQKDNLETIELSTKDWVDYNVFTQWKTQKLLQKVSRKGKQDLCLLTSDIAHWCIFEKIWHITWWSHFLVYIPRVFYFLQHNYFLFLSIPLDIPFKQKYFCSLKQSSSLKCTKIKFSTSILGAHFCAQTTWMVSELHLHFCS